MDMSSLSPRVRIGYALGSVTTYFGIEGLDTYSYGIKSQEEIKKLQAHLWEEMSDGSDDEKQYVIIGAGPTGVELAGALGTEGEFLELHDAEAAGLNHAQDATDVVFLGGVGLNHRERAVGCHAGRILKT